MKDAPALCVLGSLNMDLVVRAPRLPRPGETLLGGPFATYAGGKGGNQAVAAARAGGAVTMLGALGDDDFGARLRAGLEAAAVTPRLDVRTDAATGTALITVDDAGENTIVVAAGANATVDATWIDRHGDAIDAAALLVCQLEVPLATVAHAVARARTRGVLTVLNAAPAAELPPALLAATDVLVVNRTEAVTVAGAIAADDLDVDLEALARSLVARGPRHVVITLGAEGALACDGASCHRQASFPVTAIDAVGAGDAFVGTLAVALARRQDLPHALRTACAAGALAATRAGARPSLPTRGEVEAFLEQFMP